MKRICIVQRSTPYQSLQAREALDAALMVSAFDQTLSLVFFDGGVYQLLAQNTPENYHLKNVAASLAALDLYDVREVLVEQESLQVREISPDLLSLNCKILSRHDVKRHLHRQDLVLSF